MIKVKVPATTANIGPGFDTMGIALSLYNTYTFYPGEKGKSLMSKAFQKVFSYKNQEEVPVGCVVAPGDIPSSRGLGSSAACIVAGILAADEYLGNSLTMEEKLWIATEVEGHPDNVAPALLGGFVTCLLKEDRLYTQKWPLSSDLFFLACIPDFSLSTAEARKVLPESMKRKDALENLKRIPFLLKAMEEGNTELLALALEDRLHQPYRKSLIQGYIMVEEFAKEKKLPFYLSGAGPTLMIVTKEPQRIQQELTTLLPTGWKTVITEADFCGALVIK